MEEQNKIISSINIPSQILTSEALHAVLIAAKKQSQSLQVSIEFWNEVAQILWYHLQEGLASFDDQLLCSTCFYTVLSLTDKQEGYLNEILEITRHEIVLRDNVIKDNAKTILAVSMMYGMFQSSFLTTNNTQKCHDFAGVLDAFFKLLNLMAYEYSKYTFLVFKTLHSFKKILGTDLQETLFCKKNAIKLLNLVNHNWENPITGVRDLNKGIFHTLILVLDEDMYETILKEINRFYWNKAKYLMLAEIISQCYKDLTSNAIKYDWIDGLVCSLHKSGLVSAGADMYFSLLKKISNVSEWSQMFKNPIINLLSGSSQKAIENFTNYWCLTTFKAYPALIEMFLQELEELPARNLYSNLCIMKQANKLGLLKKNWESPGSFIENSILEGLKYNNNQIRMIAFDIVCLSNKRKMPTKIEYDIVINFLENNANSDCTVLRIGMIKSFCGFLTQIHISYLNYLKSNDDKKELLYFCYEFQRLIQNNIQIGGNYQRKITSIKLTTEFLSGLKQVPKKRQKQTRKSDKSIIQLLIDEGQWLISDDKFITSLIKLMKDPAEDIRENVGVLLLEHYSNKVGKTNMTNILIKDALKCMSSKFFYEINCGQTLIKLIIKLMIQEKRLEATFKTADDLFNFAHKELSTEFHLKRGIVESIEKGKQLHSFMSILHAVLDICYQMKKPIDIFDENINSLLDILEGISNQFAWEQDSTSSDFSKMSDMVQSIIINSGHDQSQGNDHTKISGLHQIVLNCLWLNVKASCELSSMLVKYQKDDSGISICNKALDILCHVLETCRHKGAIEAAGAALGQCIKHLTCLPEETQVAKLPLSYLKRKLRELISEASRMASVTRRGAGLSILVHQIVSCDVKRGKPLFHYFMKTILKTCKMAEDIPSSLNGVKNIDNEKDLPKAIYIHFLTRIVTDSSLASDMMFYSVELAEIAFGNLTSSYWQIRNAALQLYGALIQKLIGQKKASGTNEEIVATVGCDEIRTHSPKLWRHIQLQLMNNSFDDKVQYHSNLIPILNMLANIARRYNFSFDAKDQENAHYEMLDSLMSLLDSPIYTVRRLTAKSISNNYTFEEIYDYLYNWKCISENQLHGSLMLIANCYEVHGSQEVYKSKFDVLKMKYHSILTTKNHSYLSKELFEQVFFDGDVINKDVELSLAELNVNYRMPGVFSWANRRIKKYLQNANWNVIPDFLRMIICQSGLETYLLLLLEKIENEGNIPSENVQDIFEVLLQSKSKFDSFVIWQLLYKILPYISKIYLQSFHISEILSYLEKAKVSYKLRFTVPFVARVCTVAAHDKYLQPISKIIEELIDPETADVEMRYIAALANNELSTEINNLPEEVKITVIKSAAILLQDEDEDIRMLSAEFYLLATKGEKSLQPYICLCKIFEHSFLITILSESGISTLRKELKSYLSKVCSKDIDANNPFANDLSNIYLEVNVFKQLIESL